MGAWVTAVAAIVVAVSNYAYTWWRSRSDRIYARRRRALLDLQDSCLELREALHGYGENLRLGAAALGSSGPGGGGLAAGGLGPGGLGSGGLGLPTALRPGIGSGADTSDASAATSEELPAPPRQIVGGTTEGRRAMAEGRVVVRRSRVDDGAVLAALTSWHRRARVSWLSTDDDVTAAEEESSWEELNDVIGAALRSARGHS